MRDAINLSEPSNGKSIGSKRGREEPEPQGLDWSDEELELVQAVGQDPHIVGNLTEIADTATSISTPFKRIPSRRASGAGYHRRDHQSNSSLRFQGIA